MSDATTTIDEVKPEQAKASQDKPANQSGKRSATPKGGCPACRFDRGVSLGKVDGKDAIQCGRCHTVYFAGTEGKSGVKKSEKTISNLCMSGDLQTGLAEIFAGLKPGDSLTVVGEQIRLHEPFEAMDLTGKVSMLTVGGIAIAAEAAGFEPINPDERPIVLRKPKE